MCIFPFYVHVNCVDEYYLPLHKTTIDATVELLTLHRIAAPSVVNKWISLRQTSTRDKIPFYPLLEEILTQVTDNY